MKKQIIVIHGGDTFAGYDEYIKFLKEWEIDIEDYRTDRKGWKKGLSEKLGSDYEVIAPNMPNKINAKYIEWQIWFEKFIPYMEPEVTLIGHSMGGIFLAKYLAENIFPIKVRGLFLVAAPFDEDGSDESWGDFILPVDMSKIEKQADKIFIYQSKDDMAVLPANADKYKNALTGAIMRVFEDRGHFNQEELPEIIEDIKSLY